MKRLLFVVFISFLSIYSTAILAVDSIGVGTSPIVSYSSSELTDSSFPTSLFVIGSDSSWRLEYMSYEPNFASTVNPRQYKNSSIMAYYNLEYLLRARRGSILGRTRLFMSGGAGIFRSRINTAVTKSEYNPGFGIQGGFRYFFDPQVYFGGEAKYLYSSVAYNETQYKAENIGGLFFSLIFGIRLGS